MNQRQQVLRAWNKRKQNMYPSPRRDKAEAFFEMVDQNSDLCWDELVGEFRRNYYDAYDEIVPATLDTDDPLIMHNFIQYSDLTNPKEASAITTFVRNCDPGKHQASLLLLAGNPQMQAELKKKTNLPDSVREAVGLKVASTPAGGKAPKP